MKAKLLILSFLCIALTGCVGIVGDNFLWAEAKQIQPGMTSIQTMRILGGGPTKIIPGENRTSTWIWKHIEYGPSKAITRTFAVVFDKDHKVISVPDLSGEEFNDKLFESL